MGLGSGVSVAAPPTSVVHMVPKTTAGHQVARGHLSLWCPYDAIQNRHSTKEKDGLPIDQDHQREIAHCKISARIVPLLGIARDSKRITGHSPYYRMFVAVFCCIF